MTIKEKIGADLKDAMRAKDTSTVTTLRLINAAVKQIEVDERIVVDEARMLAILDKLAKQRNESISQFQAAGRDDLVGKEEAELEIIKRYLPSPLSEAEINTIIEEAISTTNPQGIRDMGKVIAQVKPKVQGRADMGMISNLIKAKL